MKVKKFKIAAMGLLMKRCFIIVFCLGSCVANAQTESLKKTTWDYPVKPGSEEWRFMPYAEKVEKSQPPKMLLNSWDTETLFKYCVDYPLNKVTLMFNNPNAGFNRAYEQATVWQEFICRKDALEVFTKYFETRPYKRLLTMSDIEIRNNDLFTLFFLEKLVSETDFANHLDSSHKKKLADIILQTHQSKKDYPDEFYGFSYNSSLSALVKILESDNVVSPNDEISLTKFREETGNEVYIGSNIESAIISKAFNYINK